MLFRTEFKASKSKLNIDYKSKILLLGSCFSDNIGNKLNFYCFNVKVNPFGTIYNPISISKTISNCIDLNFESPKTINQSNGIFFHFDYHSRYNSTTINSVISKINEDIKQINGFLKETNVIFITLGTSWVYQYLENSTIVSNCHKLPQNLFSKFILSDDEINDSLINMIDKLKKFNTSIKIVLTVSPVRHIKDGIIENNLSKSKLINAIHRFIDNTSIFYFPAYEILMDDLRDYRFYESDLIHPNEQAIEYIWEIFSAYYFGQETKDKINEVKKIKSFLHHKPFIETPEFFEKKMEYEERLNSIIN